MLQVKLPSTCAQIGGAKALPAVDQKTDARAAFVRDDAALLDANARLDQHQACAEDLQRIYGASVKER